MRLSRYLQRTRFRPQLTLMVAIAILALALVSSLLNSWAAGRRMQEYLVGQGLQITGSLARQSSLALLYHSPENVLTEVAATLAFPDVRHVQIVDADRRPLLARSKEGDAAPPRALGTAELPAAGAALAWENEYEWGFVAPVYAGREEDSPFETHQLEPMLLGHVLVVVGKAGADELVASLQHVNLALTLSFAILLLGLLGFLVERLIRPLNSLSALMRRAEAGEAGLRARASGPRDITDMAAAFNKMMAVLEEREAELQQSRDRALHTAQMKTQFAATVSHEVRTPLNGVVGMLDLLREQPLARAQRECVDIAWNSARALMELINGILDFSKLEAGKLELEEIEFDLREQVESVTELLARQAQQKGLDIGYAMAPGMPDRVRGDSLRVRQVLINLMSNAVKFTERGEVAVHLDFVPGEGNRGSLRVEVTDTGIGMDEATVQHVFESFAQADPSTTRKYGGTGLGLTISKHLVDLMRGEIGVRSRPGRGSTFWFTVPVEAGAVLPAPPPAPVGHALVLARDGVVRRFLEQSLAGLGLRCEMVGNAAEAQQRLELARHGGMLPALVIVDMDAAPPGSGFDGPPPGGMPPVLRLERFGMGEDGVGREDRLVKPLRHAALQEAVRRCLSRRPAPEPAPLPAPSATEAERADAPPAGVALRRVLVVEDNRTNQMVAGAMLAKSDCVCEFAANGREAVRAVQEGRFDLVLMDCNMPEMDGYEATTLIRRMEETQRRRRTPIVAMTANAQSGDEEACLAAGMDGYLAKPITLARLRQVLDVWLGRQADRPVTPEGAGEGRPAGT